jgi:hypothetical protein
VTRRAVAVSTLVVGGVVLALALAFFVSPFASSDPDGLERVAEDHGFLETATDSPTADSPLADYSTRGVDDERLSTGLAGVIGVAITLAVGLALFTVMRRVRGRPAEPAPSPSTSGGAAARR